MYYFSGYMCPEYVSNGIVSTKINVFSFGVLMLEIVSGKKNATNYDSDYPLNLIGHVSLVFSLPNVVIFCIINL